MVCSNTLYAIREVADITGVKPVTLRAWQRRYNLIQPQRSDKGHRLYTAQDVERINTIQSWLSKGVSIGKVKALIDSKTLTQADMETEQLEEVTVLLDALGTVNSKKVDAIIDTVLKEYPLDVVEGKFVIPVLNATEFLKLSPKAIQQSLFKTAMIQKLAIMANLERKRKRSAPTLLVSMDVSGNLFAWLWYARLSEQGASVTFIDGVEDVSALLGEPMEFDLVHLFAEKSLSEKQLEAIRLQRDRADPAWSLSPVIEHLLDNKVSKTL
ncbi:MerR family transcriptional regulator [Vibrio sp. 10N]|uniref:MerR family transcriptional regulator n=1 Tax=Vibrio sp. 10N TaxID=3058938 RepID=UPI002812D635|nr:MerR family transcriptional regulator [Vibrio sp. 10N]